MDEVVSKALEQATSLVTQAANKMAEIAPDVWQMLLWQARAEGIVNIVTWLLCIALWIGFGIILRRIWPTPEWDKAYPELWVSNLFITKLAPTGLTVIVMLVFVSHLTTDLLKIINPNYYAIKFLLNMGGQ